MIVGKAPPIEGGAANLTFQTALELVKNNCEVHLLTDGLEVENTMKTLLMDVLSPKKKSSLKIYYPTPLGKFNQFPKSDLRTERLIGKGMELATNNDYGLIIGWYMIPYGLVAQKLSISFNIPMIIIHGGSDLSTLARHNNLKFIVKDIFENSRHIITANSEEIINEILSFGINKSKILLLKKGFPLPNYHLSPSRKISLQKICNLAINEVSKTFINSQEQLELFYNISKYKKLNGPIFILYGKVSQGKNTINLLKCFDRLAKENYSFGLIGIFCGTKENVYSCTKYVYTNKELYSKSIILPPLSPWIIPEVLSKADVGVCCEIDFGVLMHFSILPREVINAGLALIISKELATSPFYKSILYDKLNAIIVDKDKSFYDYFKKLIDNPTLVNELKKTSKFTSKLIEGELGTFNPIVEIILNYITTEKTSHNIGSYPMRVSEVC